MKNMYTYVYVHVQIYKSMLRRPDNEMTPLKID